MSNHTHGTEPKPLLTPAEFHARLGGSVGINTIRRAVKLGRIRSLKVGERRRLIPSTELTAWPNRETGATM